MCYLDRTEFDLFTDHKALIWVFSEGNRTMNAKLARWAMELSQLRFKVYHKPGTSMGHADGLSRLHSETICALTISDLLNEDSTPLSEGLIPVGEAPPSSSLIESSPTETGRPRGALDEAMRADMDALNTVGEPPASAGPSEKGDDVLEKPEATVGDVADEMSEDGDADDEPPLDDEGLTASSPVDVFGLDPGRFKEEQRRTPWI
ncbi:hypothetical protein PF008_g9891 [Phytophthora fragariae]|uniref:Reverse transcriptase RNase H-like domain-containing protein n=1 Tax=Phytophthora fragariae TaxID=53985 RepID=A0A6G0RWV8_9STRA|nr:hypothetical protein PF008_g9891 [Phytophthora fragariae]